MKYPLYIQIYYYGQEDRLNDTAVFYCDSDTVTSKQLAQTIRDTQKEFPAEEDEDRLEWMDNILNITANKLGANWEYLSIWDVIEID